MTGRLLAIAAAVTGICSATALGQAVVPSSVYSAPQQLVAVDGARRLNVYCVGRGQPVVVLEAGSGNSMVTWRHVQSEVGGFTRVCAYDRAGLGFSDAATRPSTDANMVDDLHHLLKAADIATPILFVGHSLGGQVGLLFSAAYPEEIAGAVLVDPGFPDMLRVLQAALPPEDQAVLLDGFKRMLAGNRRMPCSRASGGVDSPVDESGEGLC
jgi:pimeloyl-ACP methyl ester carboxylesterase